MMGFSTRMRFSNTSHFRICARWRFITACLPLVFALSPVEGHGIHSSLMARIDRELTTQPEDGNLWFRRAMLEYAHGDWETALLDLDKAELFALGKFSTRWWRGMCLDQLRRPHEAKQELDDFLKSNPTHAGALASRARVKLKLNLADDALGDFRAALVNCSNAEPDLVQEVAQALAANGHEGEAIELLDKSLARLGAVPSLQLRILEIEMAAGHHDAALSRIKEIQRTAPRPEPWMEKRAAMLAEAGRTDECQTAWNSLLLHLAALPDHERLSHAMVLSAERAGRAIAILDSTRKQRAFPEFTISSPRP